MKNRALQIDRDAKVDARVSQELRKRLERIAYVKDTQLSAVVREALKTYAERMETQLAAA